MDNLQPHISQVENRLHPHTQDVQRSFRIGEWRIEPEFNRLYRDHEHVRLEPKVMAVLVYLSHRPGELVSREELESVVWAGSVVSYDALTGAIQKLRKALGDHPKDPHIIETISKKGYRFIAPVEVIRSKSGKVRGPTDSGVSETIAEMPGPGLIRGLLWTLIPLLGVLIWLTVVQWRSSPSLQGELPSLTLPSAPAIAVLPFENLSADEGQLYFSRGITEDLITELSGISGLLVMARNSTFQFAESLESPQQIGERLGVQYLLRGSVQRLGARIRIHTRLISAVSGRTLWAERYDRELSDLFALQDEITDRIVISLQVTLSSAQRDAPGQQFTVSFEAYDRFLRAQYQYGLGLEGNRIARDLYREAIELDPAFARAYGGLALTYFRDAIEAYATLPNGSIREASELANQAMALDPGLPQVYLVKSQIEMFKKNYSGSVEQLRHALELRPNYADAFASLGWTLHFAGQPDQAKSAVEQAIRLNPVIPVPYHVVLGSVQYTTGHYREAVDLLERGRDMNPEHYRLRLWLTAAYAQSGRLDDAEWEVSELLAINPTLSLSALHQMFPFRDRAHLDHLIEGLRIAGMPLQ